MKNESMKDQIALSALALVAKEGLVGLSAKKIADQLQISKSNVFHHYPTLDLLKEKLLSDLLEQLLSWPEDAFSEAQTLDAFLEQLLKALIQMDETEKLGYAALLQFHTACLYDVTYRTPFLKAKEKAVSDLCKILSRYSVAAPLCLGRVAESIVMTLDGMGLHYLLEGDADRIRATWAIHSSTWTKHLTL